MHLSNRTYRRLFAGLRVRLTRNQVQRILRLAEACEDSRQWRQRISLLRFIRNEFRTLPPIRPLVGTPQYPIVLNVQPYQDSAFKERRSTGRRRWGSF